MFKLQGMVPFCSYIIFVPKYQPVLDGSPLVPFLLIRFRMQISLVFRSLEDTWLSGHPFVRCQCLQHMYILASSPQLVSEVLLQGFSSAHCSASALHLLCIVQNCSEVSS